MWSSVVYDAWFFSVTISWLEPSLKMYNALCLWSDFRSRVAFSNLKSLHKRTSWKIKYILQEKCLTVLFNWSNKALTSHRICSRREYKHQWNGAVGVTVALTQVKWRWFNKSLSQFVSHKFADCWLNLWRKDKVKLTGKIFLCVMCCIY